MGLALVFADRLPDSLDSETLQKIIFGMLIILGFAVIIVIRTFTKASSRFLALAVIAALAFGLWVQRDNLRECGGECTCRVFGQDIDVPNAGNLNCP